MVTTITYEDFITSFPYKYTFDIQSLPDIQVYTNKSGNFLYFKITKRLVDALEFSSVASMVESCKFQMNILEVSNWEYREIPQILMDRSALEDLIKDISKDLISTKYKTYFQSFSNVINQITYYLCSFSRDKLTFKDFVSILPVNSISTHNSLSYNKMNDRKKETQELYEAIDRCKKLQKEINSLIATFRLIKSSAESSIEYFQERSNSLTKDIENITKLLKEQEALKF